MTVSTGSLVGQNDIAFKFTINQKVYIPDAQCHGRVKQLCASTAGREYQVAYFDDEKVRRVDWLGEDELEAT